MGVVLDRRDDARSRSDAWSRSSCSGLCSWFCVARRSPHFSDSFFTTGHIRSDSSTFSTSSPPEGVPDAGVMCSWQLLSEPGRRRPFRFPTQASSIDTFACSGNHSHFVPFHSQFVPFHKKSELLTPVWTAPGSLLPRTHAFGFVAFPARVGGSKRRQLVCDVLHSSPHHPTSLRRFSRRTSPDPRCLC